jgi:hypothetical protein
MEEIIKYYLPIITFAVTTVNLLLLYKIQRDKSVVEKKERSKDAYASVYLEMVKIEEEFSSKRSISEQTFRELFSFMTEKGIYLDKHILDLAEEIVAEMGIISGIEIVENREEFLPEVVISQKVNSLNILEDKLQEIKKSIRDYIKY